MVASVCPSVQPGTIKVGSDSVGVGACDSQCECVCSSSSSSFKLPRNAHNEETGAFHLNHCDVVKSVCVCSFNRDDGGIDRPSHSIERDGWIRVFEINNNIYLISRVKPCGLRPHTLLGLADRPMRKKLPTTHPEERFFGCGLTIQMRFLVPTPHIHVQIQSQS
jgi:hypothetical protein